MYRYHMIDEPLLIYRFFGKCYDAHNNDAYIMTQLLRFYALNQIKNNFNVV